MKCRKILVWLTSCLAIIALILVGAGFYFFNVACVPGQKNFISKNTNSVKKSDPLYKEKNFFFDTLYLKWFFYC